MSELQIKDQLTGLEKSKAEQEAIRLENARLKKEAEAEADQRRIDKEKRNFHTLKGITYDAR